MNALTAYSVMRKVSMYDIMLSTSNVLFSYSTIPAVGSFIEPKLFLCVMKMWHFCIGSYVINQDRVTILQFIHLFCNCNWKCYFPLCTLCISLH